MLSHYSKSKIRSLKKKKSFSPLRLGTFPRSLGLSRGRRVLRFRSAGVKHQYWLLDRLNFIWNVPGFIVRKEFFGSRFLFLVAFKNGVLCYRLAFLGGKVGDIIYATTLINNLPQKLGSPGYLSHFVPGSLTHNIELKPGLGGKLARASGMFAKVIRHYRGATYLRLKSGKELWLPSHCTATLGVVADSRFKFGRYITAGSFRRLGWRPRTRGVAMNPVDHPHGGGEGKSSGGRLTVSRWGWLTKTARTTRKQHRRL